MRNINLVAKKVARNGLKIANSLGCAFHFESDFSSPFFNWKSESYNKASKFKASMSTKFTDKRTDVWSRDFII